MKKRFPGGIERSGKSTFLSLNSLRRLYVSIRRGSLQLFKMFWHLPHAVAPTLARRFGNDDYNKKIIMIISATSFFIDKYYYYYLLLAAAILASLCYCSRRFIKRYY